jgi:hypothetical protein
LPEREETDGPLRGRGFFADGLTALPGFKLLEAGFAPAALARDPGLLARSFPLLVFGVLGRERSTI